MVGNKIRAYREFRGFSQVQLAHLSGINVGTIRKYELGIRKPKPDQLHKIAAALGLNVSVFLDFSIETVGDVLSLLYAIDDAVDLSLTKLSEDGKTSDPVVLKFKKPMLQKFMHQWCEFKAAYEHDKSRILTIEDEEKRNAELQHLEQMQEEFKLRTMGTTIGCHTVVTKGTEGIKTKIIDCF